MGKLLEFFKKVWGVVSKAAKAVWAFVCKYSKIVASAVWSFIRKLGLFLWKYIKIAGKWLLGVMNKISNPKTVAIIVGVLIAALIIIIPIATHSEKVKAEKAAAAEAEAQALEAAAKEAEEKAAQAALEEAQAQAEAEAKAAQQREEMVASIDENTKAAVSDSLQQIIDNQAAMYSAQTSSVSEYESYVYDLLYAYAGALETYAGSLKEEMKAYIEETVDSAVDSAVDSVIEDAGEAFSATNAGIEELSEEVKASQETVTQSVSAVLDELRNFEAAEAAKDQQDESEAQAAAKAAEQEKYDSHYLRSNRIDLSMNQASAKNYSLSVGYLHKFGNVFSMGAELSFTTTSGGGIFALADFEFTLADEYSYNIALELDAGCRYDGIITPAFKIGADFRYTIADGFEFSFSPNVGVATNFTTDIDYYVNLLTFGLSFTF